MKKLMIKISLFIIAFVIIISPFAFIYVKGVTQERVYINTYESALVDKVKLLEKNQNNKKMILIGDSNVAFGFDSELLEEQFKGYKVINLGISDKIGIKLTMDIAKHYIRQGDMVFIIPNISRQSMEIEFDGMEFLKSTEENSQLFKMLDSDNKKDVIGVYAKFVNERSKHNNPIKVEGLYQRSSFNEYGDIEYCELDSVGNPIRSQNRMTNYFDSKDRADFSMYLNKNFINYINSFAQNMSFKGAKVYYSFSPVNELGMINEHYIQKFYDQLCEKLDVQVIGNPYEFIMDPHYFYDSNFNLNDAGTIVRTITFAKVVSRDALIRVPNIDCEVPAMPDYPEQNGTKN